MKPHTSLRGWSLETSVVLEPGMTSQCKEHAQAQVVTVIDCGYITVILTVLAQNTAAADGVEEFTVGLF